MTFVYDPASETCHDREIGVTARWGGCNGFGDIPQRAFIFSHPDWEVRCWWANYETGIERKSIIGDLSKNEISVGEDLGPDAAVEFHTSGPSEVIRGTPPLTSEFIDILHDAIACLYTKGGNDSIAISGISRRRDKELKAQRQ